MATVKLRVSDKILEKVLWLLGQFDEEDLQIITDDEEFLAQKKYLQEQAYRLDKGEAKTYTIEEARVILEKTVRKHEG
tara:strand:- start:1090 stop:1323 length:234 start_codon:yes stop_codon:yes gene_type:complete